MVVETRRGPVLRACALAALWLVAACSGGGGGTAQAIVVFQVRQVTPGDLASGVPLTQEINVFFTKFVDPASLDQSSLQVVAESGDPIPGTREVAFLNQNVVRFLPQNEYFPFAVHTIRVSQGVRDLDGNALDKEYEFRFQAEEAGPVLPTQAQVEDLGNLLATGRFFHRMTLLPNNRFLITGGYLVDGQPALGTAENLVVPLKESFLMSSSMRQNRAGHVQVMLPDGRVLIAGGEALSDPFSPLTSCEIFDPGPFAFRVAAPMNHPRSFAHATVLGDGRVLVTGGQSVDGAGAFIFRADAEIYDPATDTWTALGARMEVARAAHFSLTTPAGDAVIVGGTFGAPSATFFRADMEEFTSQAGTPFFEHLFAAATRLPGDRALLASGFGTKGVTLWDPQFGFLNALNDLITERAFATATPFADGRVLIVGGFDFNAAPPTVLRSMDLFFPIGHTGRIFRVTDAALPRPTSHHAAALGPLGAVWITGGLPLDTTFPAVRQVTAVHPQ